MIHPNQVTGIKKAVTKCYRLVIFTINQNNVGILKSAPARIPVGQRVVTVFRRV